MSDWERKLRSGTRRDYKKMASPECEEKSAEGSGDNGGVSEEVYMDEKELFVDSLGESDADVSENEVQAMEERLRGMKLTEEKMQRKEKFRRLSQEASDVEQNLKKLAAKKIHGVKGHRGRQLKDVTTADLRGMDGVVRKVDKLMDRKLKMKQNRSTSSSSSSSNSCSSSDSESSPRDNKKTRRQKKKSKKSRSSEKKHRSGKDERLTSFVKHPQKWPHSHLSLHFVNKEKKYEELSLAEFCAGFATILEMFRDTDPQKAHRITHFKELMYLATKFQWKNVLNYHAACLLEIERGHLKWGDNFQMMQSTTLAGGFINSSRGGFSAGGTQRSTGGSDDGGRILFCKGFQHGNCGHAQDHQGHYKGEKVLLKHICAKCWLTNKKIVPHPESSEACPLKESSHQQR